MMQYGAYQAGDRLRSGAVTTVSACYADEDASVYAVKVLQPLPGIDNDKHRTTALWMLESAWAQREAAGLPGGAWAPVHDLGQQDHATYVVTDRFACSLDRLIGPGTRTDPNALRQIIMQIAGGLGEAERLLGRGHGNLKPSNILLGGFDEFNAVPQRVCLSDPAPASTLRRRTVAIRDRHALGAIIIALVTGKPTVESAAWPVPLDPAWARLGAVGEGWRSLASDLLNPAPDGGPMAWEEVVRRADLLVPPVVKPRRWPWAVAAAVLLVAAGLTTYLLIPRNLTPPATFDELVDLAQEYNNWAGTAQTQLNKSSGRDEQLIAFINNEPALAAAFDGRLRGEDSQPLQPNQLLGKDGRFFTDLLQTVKKLETNPDDATLARADQTIAFLEKDKPAARRAKLARDAVIAAKQDIEDYIKQTREAVAGSSQLPDSAAQIIDQYADFTRGALIDKNRPILPALHHLGRAHAAIKQVAAARQAAIESPHKDDPFIAYFIETTDLELEDLAAGYIDIDGPDLDALTQVAERSAAVRRAVSAIGDKTFLHYETFKSIHPQLYEDRISAGVDDELMREWRGLVLGVPEPTDAHIPREDGAALKDPRIGWEIEASTGNIQKQIDELTKLGDTEFPPVRAQRLEAIQNLYEAVRDAGPWVNQNRLSITQGKAQTQQWIAELDTQLAADIINATRNFADDVALLRSADLDGLIAATQSKQGEEKQSYERFLAYYLPIDPDKPLRSTEALEAGWRTLRDQAIAATTDQRAPTLKRSINKAVHHLAAIDRGLPGNAVGSLEPLEGWDQQMTAGRYEAMRESAITELVGVSAGLLQDDSVQTPASSEVPTQLAERIADNAGVLTNWLNSLFTQIKQAREIDGYFSAFYLADETLPAVEGRPSTLAAWTRQVVDAAAGLGITEDLEGAAARFNRVMALQQVVDSGPSLTLEQIEAEAADEQNGSPLRAAAMLAALRAHDGGDAGSLRRLLGFREPYRKMVGRKEGGLEPDRAELLGRRFEIEASKAWQDSINAATSWEVFNPLAADFRTLVVPGAPEDWSPAEDIGPAPNTLTRLSQANIYLHRYKVKVKQAREEAAKLEVKDKEAEDNRVKALASALLADLDGLYKQDPTLESLYDKIKKAIEAHDNGKQQTIAEKVGPDSPWIRQATGVDIELLDAKEGELEPVRRYRFKAGNTLDQVISFRLVQPGTDDPDAPLAYVSTNEVPAKFLFDVLDASRTNPRLPSERNTEFTEIALTGGGQPVSPVWVEILNPKSMKFQDWRAQNAAADRLAPWLNIHVRLGDFKRNALAQGVDEPTTELSPMQEINPAAAYYFARLLGCRLPTENEWHGAYRQMLDEGVPVSKQANLCDATWAKQQRHLIDLNDKLSGNPQIIWKPIWTSHNSYVFAPDIFGKGVEVKDGEQALQGADNNHDDRTVWPWPVKPDSELFRDLVGNLAEWVIQDEVEREGGGELKLPEGPASPDEVKDYIDRHWDKEKVGIIGNSALSCTKLSKFDTFLVPNKHLGRFQKSGSKNRRYSDVGFRLAFTVGQPRLSVTVQALLEKADFLQPDQP